MHLVGGKDLEQCFDIFERDVANIIADTSAERRAPAVRVAGHSSSWLVLAGGILYRDALFAVTTSPDGEALLASTRLQPRLLAVTDEPLEETLELLSAVTSAALALVAVATSATQRPTSTESDIARCRRWLQHPLLQYLTGRGAQRRLVSPWQRFLDDHEHLLSWVAVGWENEIRPRLENMTSDHPLRPLVAPLALVSIERETVEILREYRVRVTALGRECTRVASEIGIVGTLVSLVLVPVSEVLRWWFLVPVGMFGLLYYAGHASTRLAARVMRWRPARRGAETRPAACPTIARVVESFSLKRVHVLAGSRMAVADVAACVSLWLCLLQHSDAPAVLEEVRLSAHDQAEDAVRIIVGGPLVRPRLIGGSPAPTPICELTDQGGHGWHLRIEDDVVAWARDNESLGCISTSRKSVDLLFVYGTRDAGTVAAVRWLNAVLREPDTGSLREQAESAWHLQKSHHEARKGQRRIPSLFASRSSRREA